MGKMEGGTLTLRVSVQVMCCFFYHSILLISLLVLDKSLSTASTVAITAVSAFITGTVCGVLLTVCISRWNKKERGSKPVPNAQEQQQAAVVYEEVDTLNEKVEPEENVVHEPVKQSQKIELKKNVAYGPVKRN